MAEVVVLTLAPEQELTVVLDVKDSAEIEVSNGTAFCFGWKLPNRKPVKFTRQTFTITTPIGCGVSISGQYTTFYTSNFKTNLPETVKKLLSLVERGNPPVTFVVGAPGTGKTSICKEIANSVLNNFDKKCFYVSADPSQAPFCPQGCLSATPIDFPIDNRGFPISDPICFFYGKSEWDEERNPLFLAHLELLNERVTGRRKKEGDKDGGVVVDFPAVCSKEKSAGLIETLYQSLKIFHATHVIVVGNDELRDLLISKYASIPDHASIEIVDLPKLPSAQLLSEKARNTIRGYETQRYFYGDGENFNPTNHSITKGEIDLFSLGDLRMADAYLRPAEIGTVDPKSAQLRPFVTALKNRIVAVVHSVGRDEIWKQSAIGFVHIKNIEGDEMTVLKPNHEPLPSKTFVVGYVTWNAGE